MSNRELAEALIHAVVTAAVMRHIEGTVKAEIDWCEPETPERIALCQARKEAQVQAARAKGLIP